MLGKLCFKKANSVLLRRAAVSTFPSAFPCLSTRFALRQAIATSAHNFYSSRVPNNEHTTTEQLEPETVVEQEQQETEYISNELVVEIRTADEFTKYLQRSANSVVIVDCYADWCEPCRQLTPILEQVVSQYNGEVKLFKLNVDNVPDVAQHFRVEVLPTMCGIVRGNQLVAQVTGVKTDEFLKEWIGKMLQLQYEGMAPEQVQQTKERQKALTTPEGTPEQLFTLAKEYMNQGQHEIASQMLNNMLDDPAAKEFHPKCYAALILMILGKGEVEPAGQLVSQLSDKYPEAARSDADVRQAIAYYDISKVFNELEGETQDVIVENVKNAVTKDPNNAKARVNMAAVLFTMGKTSEAVEELLALIKKDKKDQTARKLLISFFDALGPNNKLTLDGRKRLTKLLF